MNDDELLAAGWVKLDEDGFAGLVGPLWQRTVYDGLEVGIMTSDKHRNRSGIVHGGLICTLADRAIGMMIRLRTGGRPQVTVDLSVTFLDRATTGDLLVAQPRVAGFAENLAFGATDLLVSKKLVASAAGVFRLGSAQLHVDSDDGLVRRR
jgi:uncharacterized protein (TIGR00369 family)